MPYRKPTNWITLAIILASLAVAVFGIVTYQNTLMVRQGETLVAHGYDVRDETHGLFSSIKDMESWQRGLLLTDDVSYLDSYNVARESVARRFAQLRQLTHDNEAQQRRLDMLQELISRKQAALAEGIALRNNVNQNDSGGNDELLWRRPICNLRSPQRPPPASSRFPGRSVA